MTTRVPVKPNLLTWAIERAGLVVDEFLIQYPKVELWLRGEKEPTLNQLEDFSKKVHVPFGYLLLDVPPAEPAILPLFRTKGNHEIQNIPLELKDIIRQTRARQEWLSEHLQNTGAEPLAFIGSLKADSSPQTLTDALRKELNLSPDWSQHLTSRQNALDYLTEAAENANITVTYNGVVGNNNRRKIPVDVCRGFVLVDQYAPFIFVNNSDAKAAQLFTLAHELAHLWLGVEGIFDLNQLLPTNDPIEQLCNQAAAELLVPEADFREAWDQKPDPKALKRQFKVSPLVLARRALDLRLWSRRRFFRFYQDYMQGLPRANQGGGGNFYATARKRLGPRFLNYVHEATRAGQLPYDQAYKLTGLKRSTYTEIMKQNFG